MSPCAIDVGNPEADGDCVTPAGRPTTRSFPSSVGTIIIGNGPSALILSYILHGNIPVYDASSRPHPDPLLHAKLKNSADLLHLDVGFLTEHFCASRLSYSTQALPVNVLLDTLVRPNGDTQDTQDHGSMSNVAWRHMPERAVSHLVIGDAARAGGQWVDNPVKASGDIGTLSYAAMLSLPGYSFADHYQRIRGKSLPSYLRPSRRAVADYFATYPAQVGIADAIHCGQRLSGIVRTDDGFYVASHNLRCKHIVLASGTFSDLIPARPLLQPLLGLPGSIDASSPAEPLLVVGSGFSAADIIISTPPSQKIIHIFKWAPSTSPSPLKACHQDAYPEYASVYRRMKLAALTCETEMTRKGRMQIHRRPSAFEVSRDWAANYQGFPNTAVTEVRVDGNTALVTLQRDGGAPLHMRVGGLQYVVGRRGSLNYLSEGLHEEVCGSSRDTGMVSGQTLREKAIEDLEISPGVFTTGSLTGDSLIRFSYGGCTYAAGRIMESESSSTSASSSPKSNGWSEKTPASASPYICAMNGLDGHNGCHSISKLPSDTSDKRKSMIEEWSINSCVES